MLNGFPFILVLHRKSILRQGNVSILTSCPLSRTQSLEHCFLASTKTLNIVHTEAGIRRSVDLHVLCSLTSNAVRVLCEKEIMFTTNYIQTHYPLLPTAATFSFFFMPAFLELCRFYFLINTAISRLIFYKTRFFLLAPFNVPYHVLKPLNIFYWLEWKKTLCF